MKKHTKVYIEAFGLIHGDHTSCEICAQKAVDIHHIRARSLGGKDIPDNLMALCRPCHIEYGDKKQHVEMLKEVHSRL